jgi:hypothetical protein
LNEALEAMPDPASSAAPERGETAKDAAQSRQVVPNLPAEDAGALDPEAWIDLLLKLQKEGRTDELRSELDAFRTAWPDYPLPHGLSD